ncbi:MAG TPA: DoxX family protein [Steroidobacteraceae bacterium]|nr:DoxX family protein [Steroidobacteraceae bacterium]
MNQSTSTAHAEAGDPLLRATGTAESSLPTLLNAGRMCLAASALGLGVLGIVTGDFALNWQPVPQWIPGRATLAYVTAVLFLILGTGLLVERYKYQFAVAIAATFVVWAVLLHGPGVVGNPLHVMPWLGFTERLEVAAGAFMLAATQLPGTDLARRGMLVARIAFGVSLPVFGIAHWVYPQFTADMIPAFIPAHLFWAYFTGAGHFIAGIAILTNVLARLAAILFAAMVSGFVLLLHVPRVIGDPDSRVEWTMLVIAMTMTGAAWCMAGARLRPRG